MLKLLHRYEHILTEVKKLKIEHIYICINIKTKPCAIKSMIDCGNEATVVVKIRTTVMMTYLSMVAFSSPLPPDDLGTALALYDVEVIL